MKGKNVERKLNELARLRDSPPDGSEGRLLLEAALRDTSHIVVAKAAALAASWQLAGCLGALHTAYDRFFTDPLKTDPNCLAKTAIAQALKELGCDDPEPFLRGIAHVQREPVFGGSHDTAVQLRATCGFGLLQCRSLADLTVLRYLTDLLGDPEAAVRSDAARALAAVGRAEGALLLRLKVHCGDERAAVIGNCLAALLALEGASAVPVAARLLDAPEEDLPWEAAAALGECREPAAFEALRDAYRRSHDPRFRRALLVSMGTSLQQDAIDYLLSLITPADPHAAADAIEALAPARFREEIRQRVERAVVQTGNDALRRTLARHFNGSGSPL